jgi:alcohol dehydrogenase
VLVGLALGARVVAVDLSAAAVARARELGATAVVSGADPAAAVREATGGGAHVSLDAVGSPSTAVASVRCLRRRGRHVQVGLLLGADSTPPLPMDVVVAHELSLHGSHGMPAHQYGELLALVTDGRLDPALLVGRVVGLEDAGAVLAAMSGPPGTVGMTVVRIDDSRA